MPRSSLAYVLVDATLTGKCSVAASSLCASSVIVSNMKMKFGVSESAMLLTIGHPTRHRVTKMRGCEGFQKKTSMTLMAVSLTTSGRCALRVFHDVVGFGVCLL